jgi:hypothetical protein
VNKTTLKIILLFTSVMIVSFIPDQFPTFFGDWLCKGGSSRFIMSTKEVYGHYENIGCQYGADSNNSSHEPTWHWGYRHHIFSLMGIVVFILNLIDIFDEKNK